MPRKRRNKSNWDLDPQKSSAAQFLTYIASTGESSEKFEIRYESENIWMSQKMLAAVYGVEIPNIAYHLRKLFADAELDKEAVIKEILTTAADGKAYSVKHYNLDVIIALGFKIDNERAVQFRKWARQILGEYTIKGWVMDDQRLKDGSPITDKYFEHLLEKIREIRLSERKFYQKITDLYATAVDYDKTALATRRFFATVQNRMHQAVNAFLDFAEVKTLDRIPLTMEDWSKQLEAFLKFFDRHQAPYTGDPVTAFMAQQHAETEFEKFKPIQDRLFMSDYDRFLLELEKRAKKEEQ